MVRNTFDGVEALAALDQCGTVSEAATRLRLTQSAVSKRLKALQAAVGRPIVEPDGRRLRLTAEGRDLLDRARPLLAGLRELVGQDPAVEEATLSLGLADSIAGSWGPDVVAAALAAAPGVQVELHAHRSVLLVESVRLGRYHLALATDNPTPPDLVHDPVVDEPMVLVRGSGGPLVTIEPSSATWRAIERRLRRAHPDLLARPIVPVESFQAALRMAQAGFGDALVPLGLVLDDPRADWTALTVSRPISLLSRKTVQQRRAYVRLRDALREAARARLAAT
jgi:DNA-binding transcriptional LysR family regulator